MTHSELLRKIKNIEKIEPSQSWISSNKAFIFDYIEAQEKRGSQAFGTDYSLFGFGFTDKINMLAKGFGMRFLFPAVSVLTVVFMTGNFVLAKSQVSLPGDALYSVKIFTEKVEVAMTLNEEKRATLNFELADKRLNEISLLTENADGKNVSGPDVDVAMENFNNHLSAAVSDMGNAVKSDSSSATAVAVAKIANNKTTDYVKKIAKAKDVIDSNTDSSSAAKDKIVETIKKIEEVNFNALAVLASLGSEVSQKVGDKINEAAVKNDSVKQKIYAMDGILAGENNIKLASDLVDQAGSNLDEAKKYLADNDSTKALEKVVATNDIISTAEKITDEIDASIAAAIEENKNKPASVPTPKVSPAVTIKPPVPSGVEGTPSVSPSPSITPEVSPTPSATPEISPAPSISPVISPSTTGNN